MSSSRLDWVDTGRGIAIVLVALFHATNWIAGTRLDVGIWPEISTVLSSLRMPMFFFLSGLFAAKWLTVSWRSLLRSKVLLFGWVLGVWSIIGMVVQVTGLHAAGQPVGITTAIRNVLLAPVNPPFELWFIWALAVFFVVMKATRAVPVTLQLIVAGLLSAFGLTIWFSTTNGLTGSAKFYFFFVAGIYLRALILRFAAAPPWVGACVFIFWAAVSVALFAFDLRSAPGLYFLNCAVGVLAGIALSRALARISLLQRLGRQTLPIYLAHTPIIICISIVLLVAPPLYALVSPVGWIVPPAAAGIAIAVAIGLYRLASRSALRFLYEPPPVAVRALG